MASRSSKLAARNGRKARAPNMDCQPQGFTIQKAGGPPTPKKRRRHLETSGQPENFPFVFRFVQPFLTKGKLFAFGAASLTSSQPPHSVTLGHARDARARRTRQAEDLEAAEGGVGVAQRRGAAGPRQRAVRAAARWRGVWLGSKG